MPVIHQFAPSLAPGDGVSNGVFYTRDLLRQLGCRSEVFSHRPPFELRDSARDIHLFDDRACDLLLVHHSMGHDLDLWLAGLRCAKVLVYHNITPASYFPEGSGHHFYARRGIAQLAEWRDQYLGAIADSAFNGAALAEHGYPNLAILPLLVDFASLDGEVTRPPWASLCEGRRVVLSVGRISANKRQDLLVDAFAALKSLVHGDPEPLLFLAGGSVNGEFDQRVRQRIAHWGLDADVVVSGFIDDRHLGWLYRHSAAYWCASEHEGFCMPLIEAGHHGVPVVAFASSSIPDTLGQGGLILATPDPAAMAAATARLLIDEPLRNTVVAGGTRNLQRFDKARLMKDLRDYLARLGVLPGQPSTEATTP
jgi:glycosyltransferase involved in cell wall biosynthesis